MAPAITYKTVERNPVAPLIPSRLVDLLHLNASEPLSLAVCSLDESEVLNQVLKGFPMRKQTRRKMAHTAAINHLRRSLLPHSHDRAAILGAGPKSDPKCAPLPTAAGCVSYKGNKTQGVEWVQATKTMNPTLWEPTCQGDGRETDPPAAS